MLLAHAKAATGDIDAAYVHHAEDVATRGRRRRRRHGHRAAYQHAVAPIPAYAARPADICHLIWCRLEPNTPRAPTSHNAPTPNDKSIEGCQ